MALTAEQRARALAIRAAMDAALPAISATPALINEATALVRDWTEGAYVIGDVRLYNGNPYKCVQAHDSTGNATWTPAVASLWMQYHGTSAGTARAWLAPAGAHDMYLKDEYMVFTDGKTYKCLSNTAYSPTDYAAAWAVV